MSGWFNAEQWLAEANRVAILDQNLNNLSGLLGLNLIEDFHRFDNAYD